MSKKGVIITRYPGEHANDEEWKKANYYKNVLLSLVEAFKTVSEKIFENDYVLEDSYPTEEEYIQNLINTVGVDIYNNSPLLSLAKDFNEEKKIKF